MRKAYAKAVPARTMSAKSAPEDPATSGTTSGNLKRHSKYNSMGGVTDTHVTHHFQFFATTSLFYSYTLNFSFLKCTSVTR